LGDEDFNAALSFRNLSQITMIAAGEINAYDILATDLVLFTDETLPTANSTKESA
jgi:large subunit ribosomal protein L4